MALSPSQYARNLRFELKLSGPVDVMAVAKRLDIMVFEEDLSGFEGCLLRANGKVRILVSSSVSYQTRKHFTIAHEFGHFYMPHHQRDIFSCKAEDIASYQGNAEQENEANEFAAEFLLPANEIEGHLRSSPDMAIIRELSEKYGTSLTATAIQVVKTTSEPVTVVLSELGEVRWFVRSKSFPFHIRRGRLHEWTYASDYFGGKELPEAAQDVLAIAWCDGVPRDRLIVEESVAFGHLGMVMSILRVPVDETILEEE